MWICLPQSLLYETPNQGRAEMWPVSGAVEAKIEGDRNWLRRAGRPKRHSEGAFDLPRGEHASALHLEGARCKFPFEMTVSLEREPMPMRVPKGADVAQKAALLREWKSLP